MVGEPRSKFTVASLNPMTSEFTVPTQGYNNVLDASDAAAAKLAATIKCKYPAHFDFHARTDGDVASDYISLQGDVNEPGAADDMIEEFSALNVVSTRHFVPVVELPANLCVYLPRNSKDWTLTSLRTSRLSRRVSS